MPNLREKQMQRRKLDILRAGRELFANNGYQESSVEEIAELAEVSLGTIYNYYKSKADLLFSILNHKQGEVLEKGVEFLNAPPSDPVEAVSGLLNVYFEELIYEHDYKRLLKDIIALLSEQPVYTEEMVKLDYNILNQLIGLVEQLQQRNLMTQEVKPEEAANLIYPTAFFAFQLYIFDVETNLETMKNLVRRYVQIIFRGLEP